MSIELEPGTLIADKYRIRRILGQGGMGVVVAAEHEDLGRPVAVKFLKTEASPHTVARFRREARILGRIDNCAAGGGIQIVTKGGVKFANGVQLHGSQVIAMGPVEFSANAGSMHGVSIITNDELDFTSGAIMGFCNGAGMEHAHEAEYFRLAH